MKAPCRNNVAFYLAGNTQPEAVPTVRVFLLTVPSLMVRSPPVPSRCLFHNGVDVLPNVAIPTDPLHLRRGSPRYVHIRIKRSRCPKQPSRCLSGASTRCHGVLAPVAGLIAITVSFRRRIDSCIRTAVLAGLITTNQSVATFKSQRKHWINGSKDDCVNRPGAIRLCTPVTLNGNRYRCDASRRNAIPSIVEPIFSRASAKSKLTHLVHLLHCSISPIDNFTRSSQNTVKSPAKCHDTPSSRLITRYMNWILNLESE